MRAFRSLVRFLSLLICLLGPALATAQEFSKEQIDQLTAQVALYPDALLSQVLMASTYPSDVAEAAKWSREHPDAKGDEAVRQVQDREWDPSVASLVAFPQVIIIMGEKPDWVRDLGDAFLAQPEDVMDSVQRLRAQAQKAGNLKSNEQTTVRVEAPPAQTQTTVVQSAPQQVIVIEPAQPQVVYVPTYNPVTVYGPWMYPAYPPIYVPPPPGYWWSVAIGTGIAWGVSYAIRDALWGGCNWYRRDVNININRYNNININRRLDVNTTRARWSHDTGHRKAVPYRGGEATRQKLTRQAEVARRDNYRGRAEAAMRDKGIAVDRAATRDLDRAPAGRDRDRPQVSRDQARDRAQAVTRDRPQPASREKERDLPQVSADQARDRAQAVTRDRPQPASREQERERVQARDRDQARAQLQKTNRDYPLKDAGSRQTKPQIDRGTASRQSMKQQRPHTRDVSRPQVQRPVARPQVQPRAMPQARPAAKPQVHRGAR